LGVLHAVMIKHVHNAMKKEISNLYKINVPVKKDFSFNLHNASNALYRFLDAKIVIKMERNALNATKSIVLN